MKRSIATALAAVMTAPVLALMGAGSATAASTATPNDCNDAYPPGGAYQLFQAPTSATVNSGANIALISVLTRGGERCNGEAIVYGARVLGGSSFSSIGADRTRTNARGSAGLAAIVVNVTSAFDWLVVHPNSSTLAGPSRVNLRGTADLAITSPSTNPTTAPRLQPFTIRGTGAPGTIVALKTFQSGDSAPQFRAVRVAADGTWEITFGRPSRTTVFYAFDRTTLTPQVTTEVFRVFYR